MKYLAFFVLLLWASTIHAATVGSDLFTDTAATALTAHTPDVGASWAAETGANLGINNATTQGSAVTPAGNATTYGRKGDDIGDDNMDVTGTLHSSATSTSRFVGVCGRMTSANFDNAMCARLIGNATNLTLQLTTEIAGTGPTVVPTCGTAATTFALSTVHTVKLEIRTGTQKVYVGGVEHISCTEADTVLQGNNYAGIIINGNVLGISVDNFLSESVAANINFFLRRRFGWYAPKEWLNDLYAVLNSSY